MAWIWKTAGDEKTCAACAAMEGTVFEGPRDQRPGPPPPLHYGCRCTLVWENVPEPPWSPPIVV